MQKDFVIQEALEEHDKDGDGFVNLEEFLGDYRRDPSKEKAGGQKLNKSFWNRMNCTYLHFQLLTPPPTGSKWHFPVGIQFPGTVPSRSLFQSALRVFGSSLCTAHCSPVSYFFSQRLKHNPHH